jgi:hypothetical protein
MGERAAAQDLSQRIFYWLTGLIDAVEHTHAMGVHLEPH